MRRDDDLIRQLMLDLESATAAVGDAHKVDGYTRDEVAYHLALILRAGLAEGPEPRYPSDGSDPTIPRLIMVLRLTPAGHDFIDTLRDDTVWKTVKESAKKAGGSLSLELLKQVGTAVIKAHLNLS